LLAGCASAPTDVTGSGGDPLAPTTSAGPTGPVGALPAEAVADLPPCPAPVGAAPVEGGLPDIALACLGPGGPVTLSGLRGPLIVNVWASWCTPCREELPALSQFAVAQEGRIAVLGLQASDDAGAGAALWRDLGVAFPSVSDPDAAARPGLGWSGLPVTYFVAADGRIVQRHVGPITHAAGWQEQADQAFGAG
jgi:thiol-disulfide isomerase/thioredoxin